MAATTTKPDFDMTTGLEPILRVAAYVSLGHAALWLILLLRWVTFGSMDWDAFKFEEALVTLPAIVPYLVYGIGIGVDLVIGFGLLRDVPQARFAGIGRNIIFILLSLIYWYATREFLGAITIVGLAGFSLLLLYRNSAWAINYPAAFWLIVFFVVPNLIVLFISLGERGPRGTIVYPNLLQDGFFALFDDYARFFSRIGGQFLYLRILWRSVWMATVNTLLCLLFGYPFAYWIARRPKKWRSILIFLVMIPFWTNFLVRTYAWMALLRNTGLINSFWTATLHEQAVALSGSSAFFTWLAEITANPLPLLFNQGAVFVGLFYGYFPFVILPLYSNLEKFDWTLLEAANDLGANRLMTTVRILFPLSLPGIVAAAIIVFVPTLGAYVTPDLLGGGQVAMLGNLLQQQFMTARDWPFGSAIGFLMMLIMLFAILIYFRVDKERR